MYYFDDFAIDDFLDAIDFDDVIDHTELFEVDEGVSE